MTNTTAPQFTGRTHIATLTSRIAIATTGNNYGDCTGIVEGIYDAAERHGWTVGSQLSASRANAIYAELVTA